MIYAELIHFYLFKFHRIGGVAAGLLLLILGVSGSVMAFSAEIDSLLHPSLFRVAFCAAFLKRSRFICSNTGDSWRCFTLRSGTAIEKATPKAKASITQE